MTETDRGGRDGFLARWSERKRAVRQSEAAEESAAEAEAAEENLDEETLAANRAAAEAVDLDSLSADSDMSPFFKAGVPAALKQAALRKLWRSHPVFACLDGLNDYDQDFNDPKLIMKVAKSSWEVGSGYAKRLLELEEKAKEVVAQAEGRTIEGLPADAGGEAAQAAPDHASDAADTAQATSAEPDAAEELSEIKAPDEEVEPAPRVPLRSRLDLAAFKDEG